MNLFICNKTFPSGVALWTDKNRKYKYIFEERTEHKVIHFQKDRTQYIAHSQKEIHKQINIKRNNAKRTYTKTDQNAPPFPGA